MSDPGGTDGTLANQGVVNDLLAAILSDQAAGRMRSLADYQAQFAGHEATVAREFAALHGEVDDAVPTIPQVEIQEVIGRGGQGVVYRGRQTWLDRTVAVKVLTPAFVHPQFTERFRREARTLASLTHPHIVTCHQAGVTDGGLCYLVMEFVDGPDLRRWLQQHGRLPPHTALQLVRDLAGALAHAQTHGIVHRDVKPENVLLQPRAGEPPFTAKLADLGLARPLHLGSRLTLATPAGTILGTPATMAPEQFDAPERVDHRADIYGLGCVLYHALTGRPAFTGDSMTGLMASKVMAQGPDPRQVVADLPAAVAALVQTMLARDPDQRPRSYAELDQRLAAWLQAAPAPAGSRRSWAAAAIALLAAAGLGTALVLSSPASTDAPALDPKFTVAESLLAVAGQSCTLRADGLTAGASCTWRQESGPRVLLADAETPAASWQVPYGGGGQELAFALDVPHAGRTITRYTRVRIVPDAAVADLPPGTARAVFADGDAPTSGFLAAGERWSRDDATGAPSVRSVNGIDTAVTRAPRGDWELRGRIDLRERNRDERTVAATLAITFTDAFLAEISVREATPPQHRAQVRITTAAAADRELKTRTLAPGCVGVWDQAHPLPIRVRWQAGALHVELGDPADPGQHVVLTMRPTEDGCDWPPGTISFGVERGLAVFRDFMFTGL